MNTKKLVKGSMEAIEHLAICAVFGNGLKVLLKKAPWYITAPVAVASSYIVSFHALGELSTKAAEDIIEGWYGDKEE